MPSLPAVVVFRGLELLAIHPNIDGVGRRESLSVTDSGTRGVHGAQVLTAPDAPAPESRVLNWYCGTRADMAALEAFLIRRRGRAVPFWCSTYRQDAFVTAVPSGVLWTIRTSAYVSAFAQLAAERNGFDAWVVALPNLNRVTTSVTAALDNLDGTSTLTHTSVAGTIPSSSGAMYSRLELVRLASDDISTVYRSGTIATISVTIETVPRDSA
jgi:hypothetical protein